jgi:signal transduction histidine kinase
MQQGLSAMIMHDMKNSIALLEMDLERLNHHPGLPADAALAYRRCQDLKARLIAFLTLYRIEQTGFQPVGSAVNVLEFLEGVVEFSPSAETGSVPVCVAMERIQRNPLTKSWDIAHFDKLLVEMAMESAINNAVRYAKQRIDVWYETEGDSISFFILDDGPAIDPAGASVQQNASSTGLGLALCQAVAAAHGRGGSVSITTLPDEGTLFTLELPTLR